MLNKKKHATSVLSSAACVYIYIYMLCMYMCVTCQCGSNHPCSCDLCGVEAMAKSTELTITQLPVISGGGMHNFFVPADKLIVIDGATFVRLDKCANTTFCLMGCRRHNHGGYFNIIDVLITLRNAAMFNHTNIVAGRR